MMHARFVAPFALCSGLALSIAGCDDSKSSAPAAKSDSAPAAQKTSKEPTPQEGKSPDAKSADAKVAAKPDGGAAPEGVKLGEQPANFKSKNQDGAEVDLWSYRAKSAVMLAFYPKNFTGG